MKRAELGKVLSAAFVVLWLFFVTTSYYVVHKPVSAENVFALLNVLGDLIVALLIFVLATAVGRRLLRRVEFATPLEEIIFHAGVGLGIVSFTTFALGLLGWANAFVFWLALLGALVVLRKDAVATWRAVKAIRLPRVTRWEKWLARFCFFVLLIGLAFTLTPPFAWDALQYHLVGPELALRTGRITVPPDNLSLSSPGLVEMLFLAAMGLKSDVAAQLIHFGYLLLTLGLVLAFAERYFAWRVGWLAVALLLAVPSFLLVSTWAYNDAALAFYSVASLFALLRARESNAMAWFVLAGGCAGFALGEKYTAAFVPLALLVLIVRPHRRALMHALLFAIVAAIVGSPWLVRNWAFMGNPVYPFVFGGRYWDVYRAEWYSLFGTGLMNEPWRLLIVPWEATVLGREGGVEYQATIGPLLLMFLPMWLFAWRALHTSAAPIRAMAWYVVTLYLVWLAGVAQSVLLSQTRLLFPALPVLALLAALAFERSSELALPKFSVVFFTRAVAGLVLSLTASSYALSAIADNPLAVLVGAETRAAFLGRHLGGYHAVAEFINAKLPSDAKLIFLWETRAYYVQRVVQADPILDATAHWHWQYGDVEKIAAMLRTEGYTHVLVHRAGLDMHLESDERQVTQDEIATVTALERAHLKQIYGTLPLGIELRAGKRHVVGAEQEPYAIYELRQAQ